MIRRSICDFLTFRFGLMVNTKVSGEWVDIFGPKNEECSLGPWAKGKLVIVTVSE